MSIRTRTAWLFLAPMLVTLGVVAAWPLARTIWFSFTDANINDPSLAQWIGFEHYFGEFGLFANATNTDGFWNSDWGIAIVNTLKFACVSVTLETMSGMGVALLLNQEFKGRALVRAAVLVPWAIPTIVSAKMWGWMLHDQFGLVNDWLLQLHLINERIAWTADPHYALWTTVAVDVWKTTPFMALLILAALQTLPKECYEAARVDGVHPLRVFWRITLPLIRTPLMVAVIFRLLDALRVFDLIYVLTANDSSTISMSGFVRREMVENGNMGYGSAAATSLFVIIGLATVLLIRLGRVRMSEETA
ncbi:MAG: sugar ABC transporter permease [Proteobacteria bacterium]|nr:sugar ABC transporter permease [Pseudomonadota bacterium]